MKTIHSENDNPTDATPRRASSKVAHQHRPSVLLRVLVAATVLGSLAFCIYRVAPIFTTPANAAATAPSQGLTQLDWQEAMLGLDAKQPALAQRYIAQSVNSVSQQSRRLVLQGRLFLNEGKLYAARQALLEALSDSQVAAEANYWLGAVHYALRDVLAAEGYWQLALSDKPKHVDTHRSLSMIYYDRGAIDHAVYHLREIAQLAAEDARPHRLLGLIHKDYERYQEAVGYYRAALSRVLAAETRQEVMHEMSQCLIKTRDYEECLSVLREALSTPDNGVLKADALVGLGRADEAKPLLDEILNRDPQHFNALVARAGICIEEQEAGRAVEMLSQAVALNPPDYLANFRLSQALRAAGDAEQAAAVASRADELKLLRERFSQLHQDATDRPEDADVRVALGEMAEELAMPQLAETWYRAAIELNPTHERAQAKLKRLADALAERGA